MKGHPMTTRINKRHWGFFAALFLMPAVAFASDSGTAYRLDDIVVSTSRNETPSFDAAQSVSVLSSDEIMASPFERVEDIVRSVPGIFNPRHYGMQTSGVSNPITMRGVGGSRVLLLVDGVPQNDNFNNSIAWVAWGHIPKEAIERIEIVRGPTSAMYGSEGLGGVIHIITKNPSAERKTILRGEAGTADSYGGYGFHTQKTGEFGFLAAGGYEESDGFYMTEPVENYNIKRYREAGKVLGKASYDINDDARLAFTALYYDHETGKGREFFYDDLNLGQYWMNYDQKAGILNLKGLAWYNKADKTAFQDDAKDNYATLYRREESPSENYGADFQTVAPLGQLATLTMGAAIKEVLWDYDDIFATIERKEGAEGRQRFVSPFANMDMHFLDKRVIVNLGARYDWIKTMDGANWDTKPGGALAAYDNQYDSQKNHCFSPKFGLTFHPDDKTAIRASTGKGYRTPSLYELYKVHVRGGGTYYRYANPDLDPEEIWSYDVGAERYFLDNFMGKVTFYQSFAKDYIGDRLITSYEKNGKTYNEYILDNISEVGIHGIETELRWQALPELRFSGNYTWNVSEIEEDDADPFQEGQYLTNDPRHKFHAGALYQHPRIATVSLLWNYYIDKYYDADEITQAKDNFWTVDIGLSRQFLRYMTAYVNIENIFDSVDNETLSPGAIYTGGLKFEF
jgi:iron complex outermembrane receptor protein